MCKCNITNKPIIGVIKESYRFCIDGEYCSGYREYGVKVTEYWKTGKLKNTAKEVITNNNIYYRYTKQNGWRQYDKIYKKFRVKNYTGSSLDFEPNIEEDKSKTYYKVNLGHW